MGKGIKTSFVVPSDKQGLTRALGCASIALLCLYVKRKSLGRT